MSADLNKFELAKRKADEAFDFLINCTLKVLSDLGIPNAGLLAKIKTYNAKVAGTHRAILQAINGEYDEWSVLAKMQEWCVIADFDIICHCSDLFRDYHIDDAQQRRLTLRTIKEFADFGKIISEYLPQLPPIDMSLHYQARDKMREGTDHSGEWK